MNIKQSLIALFLLALIPLQSWAQDTAAKPLQGWLDFLVSDASMGSVVHRIGVADEEKDVAYFAPNAQMFTWYNRFDANTNQYNRLEMVAVPDGDPVTHEMIVVAIIDPNRGRGIYMPWAARYVDTAYRSHYIPRGIMQAMLGD
jgi:hypothetical protein